MYRLAIKLIRPFETLALVVGLLHSPHTLAQSAQAGGCGDVFRNHFGPFDFRTASRDHINLVERVHFTPGVETLTRPSTTMYGDMAGDIGYTLHVFPNHHRALMTLMRLGERDHSEQPKGAKFTIECYFIRAVTFRPDDTVSRSLYALYLNKHSRKEEAIRQLDAAIEHAKENPLSEYNIGMVFLELREFDRALAQAHKASAMGIARTELEEALKRAGHWQEPKN